MVAERLGRHMPGQAYNALDPLVASVLGLDQPSTALDATAVMWAFFAAHPRA